MTGTAAAGQGRRRILALAGASGWMVLGRGSGLAWMLFLVATVGLGDYGLYAMAFAAAAVLAAPSENIFLVRSVRVDAATYAAERSARTLLGLALFALGAMVYAWSFVAGLALLIAGGEMLFNAVKSRALRDGEPMLPTRWDAARQVGSILAAVGLWLLAGRGLPLELLMLAYVLPYLVVAVVAVRGIRGVRPRWPRGARGQLLLVVDAVITALYLQGDILLLGLLLGDEVVGAYAIASQLVLAASIVGQLLGQQYTASLRDAGGQRHGGPPLGLVLGLGAVMALGTAGVGGVLLLDQRTAQVGVLLLVLAPFAGLRSVSNAWVTALYVLGADRRRILGAGAALLLRAACLAIAVLAGVAGGTAAALAAVVGEVLLVGAFAVVVHDAYRRAGGPPDVDGARVDPPAVAPAAAPVPGRTGEGSA
ncbi:hypothetical protein MT355_10905 [Rathayibacter sp. VKM Ac-2929]|uniref:hypothetical protein n=1 Tax=Rathayibacter sp. VKM Ac-2929 TaxID=2929480 RepID=UPI001FB37DA9|nr:hypothetical protein [Rathayibacter sp. VKM Ac-2929]MCJ1673762.1 hypothetical protein [Rathayibacter sp. VKM Ac-2929]